jgi:oxygen-independent coproporphyrinogen-3 oxidase
MFKNLLASCEALLNEMHMNNLGTLGLDRTLESYFLVGPYPPLMQMDDRQERVEGSLGVKLTNDNELVDLYLHFPYCRVVGRDECAFCHFYKEWHNPDEEHKVVENWIKEIELYRATIGGFKLNTIYFGGGTVSLISPQNLKAFVDYLEQNWAFDEILEVKFEIHADSSREPEKLYRLLGIMEKFVNLKILIDIQSLNPQTLNYISWGRLSEEVFFRTLNMVIEKGFKRICTGIILGLPFETPETFLEGVSKLAVIPEIEMLNIYPLMFKERDHVFRFLNHSPEMMFDVKTRDIVSLATRKLLHSFGFRESPIYFYSRGNAEQVHQSKKLESANSSIGIGASAFGHINSPDMSIAYYNLPSISKHGEKLNAQELPIWKLASLNNNSKNVRQLIRGGLCMLKRFNVDTINGNLKGELETALHIFQLHGLLEKEDDGWRPTEKGVLRLEEMSYFLAEVDLGQKLTAVIGKTLKEIYYCFPSRTKEQVSRWKSEYEKYKP